MLVVWEASSFSLARAMRVLTAFATLVACSIAQNGTLHSLPRLISSVFGVDSQNPVNRIISCAQTLGPTKCLNALSAWRAALAVEALSKGQGLQPNLTADISKFPFELYLNRSDDQLYSQLCDGTVRLLQFKKLSLDLFPGYTLKLDSKGPEKLNIDVYKANEIESGRSSMKKLKKKFYSIIPLLLLPGLIMAAILPFVLPAMKLATVGAVMLNNMALTGAIFTFLRNNAFNDYYPPKVKYINAGYKNEHDSHKLKHDEDMYREGDTHIVAYDQIGSDDGEFEEIPSINDWNNQYNSDHGYYEVIPQKIKRVNRLKQ